MLVSEVHTQRDSGSSFRMPWGSAGGWTRCGNGGLAGVHHTLLARLPVGSLHVVFRNQVWWLEEEMTVVESLGRALWEEVVGESSQ